MLSFCPILAVLTTGEVEVVVGVIIAASSRVSTPAVTAAAAAAAPEDGAGTTGLKVPFPPSSPPAAAP